MLAPTPASPESVGLSKSALDRVDAHLKKPVHRCRPLPGRAPAGLSPRQGRAQLGPGLCRYRTQGAGQGRHHLPHLFHDQGAHQRRLHDAGRGRPGRDRRACRQIHSGMEGSRRVRRRHRAGLPDQAAVPADADCRPAASHLRADLRLPAALQCRCRLSRREDRRGREIRHAPDHDREPRKNPAGVFAGRGLELLGLDRRARLPHRQDLGHAVRAVPQGADSSIRLA